MIEQFLYFDEYGFQASLCILPINTNDCYFSSLTSLFLHILENEHSLTFLRRDNLRECSTEIPRPWNTKGN